MARWRLLIVIALFFLSGCAVQENTDLAEPQFLTFDVTNPVGTYSMNSFDVSEEKEDLFEKWHAYNERRMEQDKWDAFVDETVHSLDVDADISDDWVDCDREVFVDVEVENKGDVDEEVIVHLRNEKLGVDEVEVVDVAHGYFGTARFVPDLKDAERGDYSLSVEVFRDGDVEELGTNNFSGEFEGKDSVELFVARCVD